MNIQGLRSSVAELVARLRLCDRMPRIISVNEIFLDATIGAVQVEAYDEIAKWDRPLGACRGGVVVYAAHYTATQVTCIIKSEDK